MNKKYGVLGGLALAVAAAPACMQSLDTSGISGDYPPAKAGNSTFVDASGQPSPGLDASAPDVGTSSAPESGAPESGGGGGGADGSGLPVCGNGSIIDPSTFPVVCTDDNGGNPAPSTMTPAVQLADGGTTILPCDAVEGEATAILKTYCASCHGHPGLATAPYHTVLDDNYAGGGGMTMPDGGPTLFGTFSQLPGNSLPDGGKLPLILPGDHANSELYQQVATGKMPIGATAASMFNRPTVSDIALLGAWIDNVPSCFSQFQPSATSADGGAPVDDGGGAGD